MFWDIVNVSHMEIWTWNTNIQSLKITFQISDHHANSMTTHKYQLLHEIYGTCAHVNYMLG